MSVMVATIACMLLVSQFIANILLDRAIAKLEREVANIRRRLSALENCLASLLEERDKGSE